MIYDRKIAAETKKALVCVRASTLDVLMSHATMINASMLLDNTNAALQANAFVQSYRQDLFLKNSVIALINLFLKLTIPPPYTFPP